MALGDPIRSKQDFLDHFTEAADAGCPHPRCDSENSWEIGPVTHGKYTYACKACQTRIGTQVNASGNLDAGLYQPSYAQCRFPGRASPAPCFPCSRPNATESPSLAVTGTQASVRVESRSACRSPARRRQERCEQRTLPVRLRYGLAIDQRAANAAGKILKGCESMEMIVPTRAE